MSKTLYPFTHSSIFNHPYFVSSRLSPNLSQSLAFLLLVPQFGVCHLCSFGFSSSACLNTAAKCPLKLLLQQPDTNCSVPSTPRINFASFPRQEKKKHRTIPKEAARGCQQSILANSFTEEHVGPPGHNPQSRGLQGHFAHCLCVDASMSCY